MSPVGINARKTHCPEGHPLAGDNVYIHSTRSMTGMGRRCKTCNTASAREYRARRKAKSRAAAA
jgi:hypothetical protein